MYIKSWVFLCTRKCLFPFLFKAYIAGFAHLQRAIAIVKYFMRIRSPCSTLKSAIAAKRVDRINYMSRSWVAGPRLTLKLYKIDEK